jgi:hypothetical protein
MPIREKAGVRYNGVKKVLRVYFTTTSLRGTKQPLRRIVKTEWIVGRSKPAAIRSVKVIYLVNVWLIDCFVPRKDV